MCSCNKQFDNLGVVVRDDELVRVARRGGGGGGRAARRSLGGGGGERGRRSQVGSAHVDLVGGRPPAPFLSFRPRWLPRPSAAPCAAPRLWRQ